MKVINYKFNINLGYLDTKLESRTYEIQIRAALSESVLETFATDIGFNLNHSILIRENDTRQTHFLKLEEERLLDILIIKEDVAIVDVLFQLVSGYIAKSAPNSKSGIGIFRIL